MLRAFEAKIEDRFASAYWDQCQSEHRRKQRDIEREQGFFGWGADMEKIIKLQKKPIESCEILKEYGFLKDS